MTVLSKKCFLDVVVVLIIGNHGAVTHLKQCLRRAWRRIGLQGKWRTTVALQKVAPLLRPALQNSHF
jgi:hypothetical protein